MIEQNKIPKQEKPAKRHKSKTEFLSKYFKNRFKNAINSVFIKFKGTKSIEPGKRWNIVTYGEVPEKLVDDIKESIQLTFKKLNYKGSYPEIKICEKEIFLANNDVIPAGLEIRNQEKLIILLSRAAAQSRKTFTEQMNLSIMAAHEATHFVQIKKGRGVSEIIANDRKTRLTREVMCHPLEKEANRISEEVIKEIYNIDIGHEY